MNTTQFQFTKEAIIAACDKRLADLALELKEVQAAYDQEMADLSAQYDRYKELGRLEDEWDRTHIRWWGNPHTADRKMIMYGLGRPSLWHDILKALKQKLRDFEALRDAAATSTGVITLSREDSRELFEKVGAT